jgi:hypothetical protein
MEFRQDSPLSAPRFTHAQHIVQTIAGLAPGALREHRTPRFLRLGYRASQRAGALSNLQAWHLAAGSPLISSSNRKSARIRETNPAGARLSRTALHRYQRAGPWQLIR